MVNIIWGTTKKPVSSQRLAALFEGHVHDDGDLFIGYPVIATPEGAFSIDALLISPTRGLVIFDLVEGKDLGDFINRQDEGANKLETKLRSHKPLMSGRTLITVPSVITYAPAITVSTPDLTSNNVANDTTFADVLGTLDGYHWASADTYNSVISVIQSISTIRRGKRNRTLAKTDSRGAILKNLEDSIANLDVIQVERSLKRWTEFNEFVDLLDRARQLSSPSRQLTFTLSIQTGELL
ncbi:hypothetical protein [Mesorhizobium sp.]|uniref:hypothetical protein n=1 Tax=Mesorhizobium sp. TaxID=1871066 RepID=UPI0025E94BE0|nr:hypothetical protein [Mesorhizobium sp.]